MDPDRIKTSSQIALYVRRVYWGIAILLLLLVLAGCLTSYAAGPPAAEPALSLTATVPLPSPTATASPTTMPGVTVVANVAVNAFQTLTPTATLTVTPTATLTPEPTATATSGPTTTATPSPTPSATLAPTNTPTPTGPPVTREPYQAYAWMDNYIPAPGSVVTVYGKVAIFGRPIEGANMGATFRFTNGQDYCSAYTNIQGFAACSINVGARLPSFWVFVDVVFVFDDQEVYAKTGFLVDP